MIKKINEQISFVVTEEGFATGNALLVDDEIRLLLDTGAGTAINDTVPENIDMVINSHHHMDHISGNKKCIRSEFFIHELELDAINSVAKMTATDGWDELMGNENVGKGDHLDEKSPKVDYRNLRFDGTVEDGEKISCGRTGLEVIHVPGHTPGHCAFFFPEIDFIYLADLCLTKFGPWYGDSDSDIDDLLKSLDRILEMGISMAATGHRKEILSGREKITAELTGFRDRILKREEMIYSFLKENPRDFETIVRKKMIYPVHPMGFLLFWEKCMVRNHLKRLMDKGRVARDDSGLYHPT